MVVGGGVVFGLDRVEDASEETIRFGSWSAAYIKLGAPSVLGCFYVMSITKCHVTVCKCCGYTANVLQCDSLCNPTVKCCK